jgi:biopolymer transport protein ExbD
MRRTFVAAPDFRPFAQMNTTPLIDVLLVLLIMFILTIPAQTHKVGIDLPVPRPGPASMPETHRLAIAAA